jgi:hypothetical protein
MDISDMGDTSYWTIARWTYTPKRKYLWVSGERYLSAYSAQSMAEFHNNNPLMPNGFFAVEVTNLSVNPELV